MVLKREPEEKYTHNNLKTYDSCKRKYYYEYILKLHWPDLSNKFELGLKMHKLFDYQAKGFDVSIFLNSADDKIKELWNIIKNDDILNQQILESEWGFNIRVKDSSIWIEGRIDRLIYDQTSKKHIIIDFKTGQQLPNSKSTDWQSIVYLYSIALAKKIDPDNLEFLYYKLSEDTERRQITYNKELHQTYESMISTKVKEIQTTTVWNQATDCKIKFCQYNKLCKK